MPLSFVLDENQRGLLWQAIQQHNALGLYLIDAVRVGDPPDLPLGTADPDIITSARKIRQQIVVTSVVAFWSAAARRRFGCLECGGSTPLWMFGVRRLDAALDVWSAAARRRFGCLDVCERHSKKTSKAASSRRTPKSNHDNDYLSCRRNIRWAEREGRLIVSEDRATMRTFLARHLQAGGHCPGLLLLRPRAVVSQVVFALALITHAADPLVLQDSVEFIP